MAGWFKAAGAGIGYYLGGPVGALLGYFLGKAMGNRSSPPSTGSPLAQYYEVLRVSPKAGMEEIRQSYRRLVKRYHPDLHSQVDEERAMLLRQKMAKVNEAYSEIKKARNF
jgi:DnaJ-domain-containing protein 1